MKNLNIGLLMLVNIVVEKRREEREKKKERGKEDGSLS